MSDAAPPPALRAPDQKFCFACGRAIHQSAASCPQCGADQGLTAAPSTALALRGGASNLPAGQSKFRFGCGARIHMHAPACPVCGALQEQSAGRPQKDRTIAIVLAFLLGGLGAHRFYLGNVLLGVVYLLLCWTLIPALIAMVEGILLISMNDADFHRRYG